MRKLNVEPVADTARFEGAPIGSFHDARAPTGNGGETRIGQFPSDRASKFVIRMGLLETRGAEYGDCGAKILQAFKASQEFVLDALETLWPNVFTLLKRKYYVDEAYEWAIVGLNAFWAKACDWLDRWVWDGIVQLVSYVTVGLSWVNRSIDEFVINLGFDETCKDLSRGGGLMSRLQDGRIQHYLRLIGVGLVVLALFLVWGCAS